ncbi:MFS general substrate transporter [Periconia macrospinosa]|uniref:MFS general substrate transporter n=1 Tax=Periconia macrospinosa TaxID=97972 RepID=A0A2V1ECS2_9PLEO|nr:MFS general substrate transporter [Periconia macrospinosa]
MPNSLWRNRIFTTICVAVFLTWGIFNALETYLTLFFQDVQGVDPMQTALRFLPTPIVGALVNIFMGMYSHKFRADYTLIFGAVLTCIAALLFCVIQPEWIYWACAFPVVALNPIGADTLFTISNLVITSVFPERTQGLAGGVFNTISQLGKSVGLATSGVIATTVTESSRFEHKESPEALMEGYRAALWFNFAASAVTILLLCWGLNGIGRVGAKRE